MVNVTADQCLGFADRWKGCFSVSRPVSGVFENLLAASNGRMAEVHHSARPAVSFLDLIRLSCSETRASSLLGNASTFTSTGRQLPIKIHPVRDFAGKYITIMRGQPCKRTDCRSIFKPMVLSRVRYALLTTLRQAYCFVGAA